MIGTNIDGAGPLADVYRQGASHYAGAAETDATNRIQYAPHGASMQMKLGNLLWEQSRYNMRLQMTQTGWDNGSMDSTIG